MISLKRQLKTWTKIESANSTNITLPASLTYMYNMTGQNVCWKHGGWITGMRVDTVGLIDGVNFASGRFDIYGFNKDRNPVWSRDADYRVGAH